MARRPLSAALALALGAAALAVPVGAAGTAQAAPPGAKDVTAVLFEWNFASVAKECTNSLGPAGYGYVQVSPPQEHIQGGQWWTSYQPVSYKIAGRLGDRDGLQEHGQHLPRRRREGHRRHRHQPHVGRHRHRHRRLLVHQVRLPRRSTPSADMDDCTSHDQQLQRPRQRPELRTGRPRRPGHRRGLRPRPASPAT